MKSILIFVLFFASFGLHAQQDSSLAGKWMVGGNAQFNIEKIELTDESLLTIFINPQGGYFFTNSFVGGLRFPFGFTVNSYQVALLPFVSYYIPIKGTIRPFIELNSGVEWDNTIGGNLIEFGGNALETTDGNYVVLGHSQSGISGDKTENSLGSYDYWFLILNSNGSILYQDTIGGDQVDSNFFMDYSQQGESFYIVGSSFSNISGDKTEDNIGGTDFWIVKLDNVLNIAIQEFRNDLTLFPNPGKDFLVWNYPEMNIEQLKVFDIHGKQLNLISEISENRLDISRLASGVYVIQLTSEGTTITKKFIKE